jgi:hypothetical protein
MTDNIIGIKINAEYWYVVITDAHMGAYVDLPYAIS